MKTITKILLIAVVVLLGGVGYYFFSYKPTLTEKDVIHVLDKIYGDEVTASNDAVNCCLFSDNAAESPIPKQLSFNALSSFFSYAAKGNQEFSAKNRYEIRHLEIEETKAMAIVHVDLFKTVVFKSGESENWYRQVRLVIQKNSFSSEVTDLKVI